MWTGLKSYGSVFQQYPVVHATDGPKLVRLYPEEWQPYGDPSPAERPPNINRSSSVCLRQHSDQPTPQLLFHPPELLLNLPYTLRHPSELMQILLWIDLVWGSAQPGHHWAMLYGCLPPQSIYLPTSKGTIRRRGGEALFGPNGPDFLLSLMFSFPKIIHPITFPGVQNFVAINFSTWTPLCELGCAFCTYCGSTFHIWISWNSWRPESGENFPYLGGMLFIFLRLWERSWPPSPFETSKWKSILDPSVLGPNVHWHSHEIHVTLSWFSFNVFIVLPKSPCLNPGLTPEPLW